VGDGQLPTLTKNSTIAEWLSHPAGKKLLTDALPFLRKVEELPQELAPMLYQTPLVKMTAWQQGISEETIKQWVRAVNS
jgi:beta-glucosidase